MRREELERGVGNGYFVSTGARRGIGGRMDKLTG